MSSIKTKEERKYQKNKKRTKTENSNIVELNTIIILSKNHEHFIQEVEVVRLD